MKANLKNLAKLEKLRSLKSQIALQKIISEEVTLRTQIETLKEHRRESYSLDVSLNTMRSIGSDVLWQAWIDRTQADVNMELARTLARKEPVMRQAKRDIGKKEVAQAVERAQELEEKSAIETRSLNQLLNQAVILSALGK